MANWLDKYDAPKAENGIEGTMGGLTDVGFNYNGAWGGTMAMGGSMPGAVGFTYARTGSIPANGPYAKKTMASAQKGKVITKREDFEPWWNWGSVQAAGGERRQETYGALGDLYAYYAGQPLKHNVLEHSQYKPTNSKDSKANYISINDPKFKQEVIDNYNRVFVNKQLLKDEKQIDDQTYAVSGYTRPTKEQYKNSKPGELYFEKGKEHVSNAIGHYFLSKGKDDKGEYISYYDVFDTGTGGSNGGGIGETLKLTKPFEVYDRIYLDPKTGKPKLQNGGEMKYYQEGLDWKPRNISRDGSEIPVDPMGYWNPDNVGEPVIIPSNEITMQGVYEPLLGISDTGDTQMMYPGEDYTFDGESVTEYPVAQNGKKVKIPMSDFKKMGNSYVDSVNTYDYNQVLWEAVNRGYSSEVDKAISRNKSLIKNTSKIKPTSYDDVNVGGKNYRIPNYEYPKMDPWENYEPVEGWWEKVNTKLDDVNNYIGKTSIGKSLQDVNDKMDKGIKNIWRKFVGNDDKDDVQNQGATSSLVKKQPVPVKKQFVPPKTTTITPSVVSKPKPKPTTKSTTKSTVVPKKEQPVKKTEQPKPIERKQNVYEGTPVYSGTVGSGGPSALIGFSNQKGDTTFIKPEDYERFGVPKYGKEFIQSRKKQRNGGVNSADAQPIEKLDQLLNFTNYNKPTKGGWLDKYQ